MTGIIDSGASCYMTLDEIIFTKKRAIECSIMIANQGKLHAQSIGSLEFNLDGQTIFMTKVLYILGLDVNLFLFSALNRNRLNVLFRTNRVEI